MGELNKVGNFYIIYNLKGAHRRQGNLDAVIVKSYLESHRGHKGGRGNLI